MFFLGEFHDVQIETRAGQKPHARIHAESRGFNIQDGSRADDHMRKALHQVRNYFQGAWHGHSDFHDGNAPASNHFGGKKGIFRGRCTDGRNDSDFLDLGADLILFQGVSSAVPPASRLKVNS